MTMAGDAELGRVDGWQVLTEPRADPELRRLIEVAAADAARRTISPSPPRAGSRAVRAVVVQILAVSMVVWLTATSASEEPSAHVHDTGTFVEQTSPSAGRFLVPTVAMLSGASGVRAMIESRASALAAAEACAGKSTRGIAIDTGKVSGSSAGLMLALTVLDRIASEDLLRGRVIAGTGAIHRDGRLGPVAAVGLKAAAAAGAGAELFLVPRGQAREARGAAEGMRVLPVGSLDEAVRALGGTGCARP